MKSDEYKLTWLASFSHFITHGYMTLLPGVLVVIAAEQSLSFMDIGIIANIGYFLYGLGSFPAGYLADKFGSKRLLTVGVVGMACSSILVGLSASTISFGVAYGILGLFASIHHPAGLSLIARRVTTHKGKAMGLHGVLGNVGLFCTPLMAGLSILLFHTWRSAYIIFGVVGLLFAMVLYSVRIESEPDLHIRELLFWKNRGSGRPVDSPRQQDVNDRQVSPTSIPVALLCLYMGSILSGFIFRGSLTFFPALFKENIYFITTNDEPVVIAGFVTTAVLSLGLVGAWFGGYINDKIKRPEFVPVIIFVIISMVLYLISRFTDSWLLAVASVFSLIYYAWQPSHNYLIAKYTRKASHGMGFGVNFFLIFGIGSVATALGGYMADNYGVDSFYWLMAFIAVAALVAASMVIAVRRFHIKIVWQLVKETAE